MTVTVTIRDARDGHVRSEAGGQLVMVFQSPRPIEIGEHLRLPDGSFGKVERTSERRDAVGHTQTVMVV